MVKRNDSRPTVLIQALCIIALVMLVGIDGYFEEFEVPLIVYAIIGGILFGVGSIRDLLGGKR